MEHRERIKDDALKVIRVDVKDLKWLVDNGATHEELIERIKVM